MSSKNRVENFACPYFRMGACKFGDKCRRSHDPSAPFDEVCRYYQTGNCSYGKKCRYLHVKLTREPKTKVEPPPSTLHLPFTPSTKVMEGAEEASTSKRRGGKQSLLLVRPLCPYMAKSGICPEPFTCEFTHGDICDYCALPCLHPYDEAQRKQHHRDCIAEHERSMEEAFALQASIDKTCGICLDKIVSTESAKFGILENCDHCYCLECIRKWRSSTESFDKRIVKGCPECRKTSDFVIPSTFWYQTKEDKKKIINDYKTKLASIDCVYFDKGRGDCPFADKCFYRHQYEDGTIAKLGDPETRKLFDESGHIIRPQPYTISSLFDYPINEQDQFSALQLINSFSHLDLHSVETTENEHHSDN